MNLKDSVSWIKVQMQEKLFPHLAKVFTDPITEKQKKLTTILEIAEIERYVKSPECQWMGRNLKDRFAIARAFIAKAVYGYATTRALIEGLKTAPNLANICGFDNYNYIKIREGYTANGKLLRVIKRINSLPSEATFSRAFAEFAENGLGDTVHDVLVKKYLSDELIGHISRDSTAINGNEKPARKDKEEKKVETKPKKKGRPKKGEVRENEGLKKDDDRRIVRQVNQTAQDAIKELPTVCDVGCKKNAHGYKESWSGFKLHIDTNDCGLPLTVVLTSASLHDSQVAIPMMKMTTQKVNYLYDLMDSAYDAKEIDEMSRTLGHVPIIDRNPRRADVLPMSPAEAIRYNERTVAERLNSRLKCEFGGKTVMVRGYNKVKLHLMFGIIALFADQMLKLL